MPCYQCVHCGKCPVGSLKSSITCSNCGSPLGPGISECPQCGQSLQGHMHAKAPDAGFTIRSGDFIAGLGRNRDR